MSIHRRVEIRSSWDPLDIDIFFFFWLAKPNQAQSINIYFVGFLTVYKLNNVVLEIRKYATRNVKKICTIYKRRLMSILFYAANTKYVILIVAKRISFPFVAIFSDQFFFSSRCLYFSANGLCFNP